MVVFMTVTVTPISFKPNQKSPFKWSGRPLDPAMVRANSFGLPYREPQPVDAPGELLPKKMQTQIQQVLQAQWGFNDSDDVRQTCEILLGNGMHYRAFDAMLTPSNTLAQMYRESASPLDFRTQTDLFTSFLRGLYYYNNFDPDHEAQHFHHWVNMLVNQEFQNVCPDRMPHTTRAWDVVRVELTAGRAVGCGLLSPEEGQDYSHRAVQELQKSFADWYQVALSFWWGRAMWMADEPLDIGLLTVYDDLFSTALTHPDSPWVKVPLQP